MRIFIRYLAVLAVMSVAVPARALETSLGLGEAGFQFLKLPLSPRTTAMGGAGAGLVEGMGESEVNPAAAARSGGTLVLGQEYPAQEFGTTASHLSWSLPWGDKRVTLNTRYLGFEKIPGWSEDNEATTAYDAYTLKLQAGLAGQALGFAYGASLAYAQNNIAEANYAAGLVNVGLWRDVGRGFSVGGSVMNADFWTATSKVDGDPISPPTIFQAGVGYVRPLRPGMRIAGAVDVRKANDEDVIFPAGVELMLKDALFIRGGYPFGDPDNSFDLGFGLAFDFKGTRFGFNYAYKGHSTLSGGHGWTLEIKD